MTDPKQSRAMAAKEMAYARNNQVTIRAGMSSSQKRMEGQV